MLQRTSKKPVRVKQNGQVYWSDVGDVFLPNLNLPDLVGTPTGILDKDGQEIVRPPRKIGFV